MEWVNTILQGMLLGGLYAMFAAGLSLIFGVMRLVNIAHGEQHAGDGDDRKRQRHRQREHMRVVQAHELRDRRIVRRGAKGAAERGAVE